MKVKHSATLLCLLGISLLTGCSGEQYDSSQADTFVEQLTINEQKMYGAWQSSDGAYGYEFHASPTQIGTLIPDFSYTEGMFQPEGVLYKDGKPHVEFVWSLQPSGTLRLDIKESTCQAKPLTLCTTDSIHFVEVLGSNEKSVTFKVSEDTDLDGKSDSNFQWKLAKKAMPELAIGEKSYLIETMYRAYGQFVASNQSGQLTLRKPTAKGDHEFAEIKRDTYSIDFEQTKVTRFAEAFFVYNHGTIDLNIVEHFEYLKIYPAFDDSLILSYRLNREFELPDNVNRTDVDLDGYIVNSRASRRFRLADVGNYAPNIVYGREYYGSFEQLFGTVGLDDGMSNQMIFVDDNKAIFTTGDVLSDEPLIEKEFSWRKGSHAGEFIFESDRVRLTMEFLFEQQGRHRVVSNTFNKLDDEYAISNASEYFFESNDTIDLTILEPLNWQFVHVNGVSISPVRLLEGGEVELVNVTDVEGGRWQFDGDDGLVRFECANLAEVVITDYDECLDSFNYVATTQTKTTYSHISKLKFINKIGNNYLVRYDAAFWGGRWDREEHIRRFSSYYQWIHLPE